MLSLSEDATTEPAKSGTDFEQSCFNKEWILQTNQSKDNNLTGKEIANGASAIISPRHDNSNEPLIAGENCLEQRLNQNNNGCPIENLDDCQYAESKLTKQQVNDFIVECPREYERKLEKSAKDEDEDEQTISELTHKLEMERKRSNQRLNEVFRQFRDEQAQKDKEKALLQEENKKLTEENILLKKKIQKSEEEPKSLWTHFRFGKVTNEKTQNKEKKEEEDVCDLTKVKGLKNQKEELNCACEKAEAGKIVRIHFPRKMTLKGLWDLVEGTKISKRAASDWLQETGDMLAKIIQKYASIIPQRSTNESVKERIKKYGYLSQLKGVKPLKDPSDDGTRAHIAVAFDVDFKMYNNPEVYKQIIKELSEKAFKKVLPLESFTVKASKEGSLILLIVIVAVEVTLLALNAVDMIVINLRKPANIPADIPANIPANVPIDVPADVLANFRANNPANNLANNPVNNTWHVGDNVLVYGQYSGKILRVHNTIIPADDMESHIIVGYNIPTTDIFPCNTADVSPEQVEVRFQMEINDDSFNN